MTADDDMAAVLERYTLLVTSDPDGLEREVRRLGQQQHVRRDPALSLMLGLLLGRVRRLQETIDQLAINTKGGSH